MDRRRLLKAALGLSICQVIPTNVFADSLGGESIGGLGQSFAIRVYGRNDSPLGRILNFQSILQGQYDHSYYVMSDPLNHPQNSDHWRMLAEESRGIDIAVSTDNIGMGQAVRIGDVRRVLVDEGYMHCAVAFAFCQAHVLTKRISRDEFHYYFNNFYDSLKYSDPIPYFRGMELFHTFFVEQDFGDPRLGEQFFQEFSRCLAAITTYVLYHEIGHHVLGHFGRTGATDEDLHEMELEADRYAIDVCLNGLKLCAEVGFFYFNVFHYMRRLILVSRGTDVPLTHPDPKSRFDENIHQFLGVGGDAKVASSSSSIFQNLIEFLDSVGPDAVPFGEQRFGQFSVNSNLPTDFQRFLRRSCNLRRFADADVMFSGDRGENAVAISLDPTSLAPIGVCDVTFIP